MKYNCVCEICGKEFFAIRAKDQTKPRFCGKKCFAKDVKKYLRRKFVYEEASDEQRTAHIREYFEKNVIRKDGCWDWKKAAKTEKYLRMNFCRKEPKMSVHIYSWKLHNGDIPDGMWVLHKCDNRRCSNPEHLFLGTSKDNINDMISKQRNPRGSTHGMAKLDETKALDIRSRLDMGVPVSRIMRDFNISKTTVLRIKNRKRWTHII